MQEQVRIAVIGGSGLYNMPEITEISTREMDTPFGPPGSPVVIGTLRGRRVAFIARHGPGHVYSPATVPYRANICALKMLGVRSIISVNACGSLREELEPGHIVIPDQIFDYTIGRRDRSFFETGIVAHTSVADPFCLELGEHLHAAVQAAGGTAHKGGTFLIEDGPRFATRAESHIFRAWGCHIIGMTTAPEAFLAREAEISYATMAHITDYDVWHEEEAPVTVEMVMATFSRNIELAQKAIAHAVEHLDEEAICACHSALDGAIMTARDHMPPQELERLRPLLARVLGLDA